jgi:hypothetical protein
MTAACTIGGDARAMAPGCPKVPLGPNILSSTVQISGLGRAGGTVKADDPPDRNTPSSLPNIGNTVSRPRARARDVTVYSFGCPTAVPALLGLTFEWRPPYKKTVTQFLARVRGGKPCVLAASIPHTVNSHAQKCWGQAVSVWSAWKGFYPPPARFLPSAAPVMVCLRQILRVPTGQINRCWCGAD